MIKKLLVTAVSFVVCFHLSAFASNPLYGLVDDGTFAKYNFDTSVKTILRTDVFVSDDNRSTYDSINHRFYSNTNDNLIVIDTQTASKESLGNVFGRNVSIEYDPAWNCLFGLVDDGTFAKYDLDTLIKTILRTDVFVSHDNRSTYDPINHLFYSNTNDNLVVIDIQAGTKKSLGNVFGRNVSIEYDSAWNCLFGLVDDGTFAKYDLNALIKTILRTDVFVSHDNRSTYDPVNHLFYSNTNDNLVVIDIQAGTKTSLGNVFGRNVSIEYAIPEPASVLLFALGGLILRRRQRSL